jgi:hypothetical protein
MKIYSVERRACTLFFPKLHDIFPMHILIFLFLQAVPHLPSTKTVPSSMAKHAYLSKNEICWTFAQIFTGAIYSIYAA